MTEPYKPVSCDFHDELTELATLKIPVDIVYKDQKHQEQEAHDVIADIFTQGKEEFLKLQHGEQIRLDHVISINGKKIRSNTSDMTEFAKP